MLGGVKKKLKLGRMTDVQKATRARDAWKVMIIYAKESGTWLIV